MQLVGEHSVDRTQHVWRRVKRGLFKCVLCGAVSGAPTESCEARHYEPLTDEDRAMCPPAEKGVTW